MEEMGGRVGICDMLRVLWTPRIEYQWIYLATCSNPKSTHTVEYPPRSYQQKHYDGLDVRRVRDVHLCFFHSNKCTT